MMSDPDGGGSPLSWRDVYRAVGESEVRLIAAIDKWGQELKGDFSDHEMRIRMIEEKGSSLTQQVNAQLTQHMITAGAEIRDLQTKALVSEAAQITKGSILVSARTIVVAFFSVIASIIMATTGAVALLQGLFSK